MSDNIVHATLVDIEGHGVLLRGKSSSGKSDLALRLIANKKAVLVADDIVVLSVKNNILTGSCHCNIKGLLEVRGIGIIKYPFIEQTSVELIVHLTDNLEQVERMPKKQYENILGLEIPQIDLYAKENSAPDKVVTALKVLVTKELELKE